MSYEGWLWSGWRESNPHGTAWKAADQPLAHTRVNFMKGARGGARTRIPGVPGHYPWQVVPLDDALPYWALTGLFGASATSWYLTSWHLAFLRCRLRFTVHVHFVRHERVGAGGGSSTRSILLTRQAFWHMNFPGMWAAARILDMERPTGVEPVLLPWQGSVLPHGPWPQDWSRRWDSNPLRHRYERGAFRSASARRW